MAGPPRYESAAAFRRALEDRLRERAMSRGEDLQRLRRLVAFDRVAARLAADGDGTRWILKGGYALELRFHMQARSTKDLDLALRSEDAFATGPVYRMVQELLQSAMEHGSKDHFEIYVGSAKQELTGPPEGGARFPIRALLDGRRFTDFQMDVALGDLTPARIDIISGVEFLGFAEIPAARIALLPVSNQFAEKIHAYTRPRGRANTRVKDLADLVLLTTLGGLNAGDTAAAVRAIFGHYRTHELPQELPPPPGEWKETFADLAAETGSFNSDMNEAVAVLQQFWRTLGFATDS